MLVHVLGIMSHFQKYRFNWKYIDVSDVAIALYYSHALTTVSPMFTVVALGPVIC